MNVATRIIVTSTEVTLKSGTSNKTGKPYTMRSQHASLDGPRFRMPVELTLGDQQVPHAPGVYAIDFDSSIAVGRFGSLGFERSLTLVKVADLPAKKAA